MAKHAKTMLAVTIFLWMSYARSSQMMCIPVDPATLHSFSELPLDIREFVLRDTTVTEGLADFDNKPLVVDERLPGKAAANQLKFAALGRDCSLVTVLHRGNEADFTTLVFAKDNGEWKLVVRSPVAGWDLIKMGNSKR